MRRMVSLFMVVVMVLGTVSFVPAFEERAEATSFGDFTYTDTGSAITITAYTGVGGEVEIPSAINGKPVTSLGEAAFLECQSITSINIPNGITSINGGAFFGCINLTNVNIPNSVTSIGNSAFAHCANLTGITIPSSVTGIGDNAFYACSALTITTYLGSVAESYAKANSIPISYIGPTPTPMPTPTPTPTPVPINLQSSHPYENNQDTTWVYTASYLPEYIDSYKLSVTFSADTQTEANCDYIYIYDGKDNQIGKYSGNELSGKTIYFMGVTVKIRLTSDDSAVYNGFLVKSVVAEIVAPTYSMQPAGAGTASNPYLIWNSYNLNWVVANNSSNIGYSGKYFKQTANIDISSIANWTPIGNSATTFRGTYDGDGHTISGLQYSGTANFIGLFGYTASATIKNLGVINVNINSSGDCIGGLAGATSGGSVTNSFSKGVVRGRDTVGGLLGNSSAAITNCYSTVAVSGRCYVGGLVGYKDSGTITTCFSTGTVSGGNNAGDDVGGLVGENYSGSITNSFSNSRVSGGGIVGGLVGANLGTITNSYSIGTVSGGSSYTGGFVGYNAATITNSYSTGSVSGSNYVGGLVGYYYGGTISNCYYVDNKGAYGIGFNRLNILPSCYQQSMISFYKTLGSYTKASSWNSSYPWNFTSIWGIDGVGIVNNGYPYLLANLPEPIATPTPEPTPTPTPEPTPTPVPTSVPQTTIPPQNIAINNGGTITNPYGKTGGSIVRVDVTGIINPTTDNKVVMVKGVPARYTYYNGLYKFVALIDGSVTVDDVSITDGTPTKLIYADISLNGTTEATDVNLLKGAVAGNRMATNYFELLASDVNGDGFVNATDYNTLKGFIAGNLSVLPVYSK